MPAGRSYIGLLIMAAGEAGAAREKGWRGARALTCVCVCVCVCKVCMCVCAVVRACTRAVGRERSEFMSKIHFLYLWASLIGPPTSPPISAEDTVLAERPWLGLDIPSGSKGRHPGLNELQVGRLASPFTNQRRVRSTSSRARLPVCVCAVCVCVCVRVCVCVLCACVLCVCARSLASPPPPPPTPPLSSLFSFFFLAHTIIQWHTPSVSEEAKDNIKSRAGQPAVSATRRWARVRVYPVVVRVEQWFRLKIVVIDFFKN